MIYDANMQTLVDLKKYTTFRMGGKARYFCVANSVKDVFNAITFAKKNHFPIFVLGSGSNIIVKDSEILETVVIKNEIKGFEIIKQTVEEVEIKIGAGEIWDNVVKRTVDLGFSGIEALSAIPGTAGATPIQNVGAYGTEISDVLLSLEALEIDSGKTVVLMKEQCDFKYRDSIFKHATKNKYIIISITLRLSKSKPLIPNYPGVIKYFELKQINQPNLEQIRQAVIEIRSAKLPDPSIIASVGSFFKNPFVSKEHYSRLKNKYPDISAFPQISDVKISAGWLMEKLGYKGKRFGDLQFYPDNALVLTNLDDAKFSELEKLIFGVKTIVKKNFDIDLEVEPDFIQ